MFLPDYCLDAKRFLQFRIHYNKEFLTTSKGSRHIAYSHFVVSFILNILYNISKCPILVIRLFFFVIVLGFFQTKIIFKLCLFRSTQFLSTDCSVLDPKTMGVPFHLVCCLKKVPTLYGESSKFNSNSKILGVLYFIIYIFSSIYNTLRLLYSGIHLIFNIIWQHIVQI